MSLGVKMESYNFWRPYFCVSTFSFKLLLLISIYFILDSEYEERGLEPKQMW